MTGARLTDQANPGGNIFGVYSKSAATGGKRPNCSAYVPLANHPKATIGNHVIANLCRPALIICPNFPRDGFGLRSTRSVS